MAFKLSHILSGLTFLLGVTAAPAQTALTRAGKGIAYNAEAQVTASDGQTPLWLSANRHGLSSVKGDNGYLRAGIFRPAAHDSLHNWRIGYGADIAVPYNFTSGFVVQQLYADFDYKKLRLSAGSKERPMQLKNNELSSGSQTFGINARPVPQIRVELPEYLSITGRSNWAAIKGHFGYGMLTDGSWQESYVVPGHHYAKKALYHTKAGYLRIGNEEKFPLVFEGGLEMACLFGGTIYNPVGREGLFDDRLEMGNGPKDFIDAIFGTGSDATDEDYANSAGNTLGSWLFSLSYKGKGWKLRAYYDHFFEDHSMMFFQYGWRDGLLGVEFTAPRNPVLTSLVYEYVNTAYQSGPVYHDHTAAIPDQISGTDNYYNHNLYAGWQHWGQAIGNPLFLSPLYNRNGRLDFTGNRFRAHHLGLSGDPAKGLHYRLLYSYMRNWGTYASPFEDVRYSSSFLAEANYSPSRIGRLDTHGWQIGAAFALDRSKQYGNNTGFRMTIRKTGILTR